ncbi:MAG: methyltransferase domain-containing protein [Caldilineaceae bacterium]|nr:methyltransferase domain-containing protein [Caldilineaceae bacterium]
MNHTDHVNLLRNGIPAAGGVWADFGSGCGAFTLALAELLGPNGEIFSVDQDGAALRAQEQAMRHQFPQAKVHYCTADFSRTLPQKLPPLDGLVVANALHFQPYAAQASVVTRLKSYLRPGGHFIIVEYDVDRGNMWVPYPLAFPSWQTLAHSAGFAHTQRLASRPSRFLHAIYAALSWSEE